MAAIAPVSMVAATITAAALAHDMEEAVLGDIPTPTKTKMRDLGFDPLELDKMVSGSSKLLPIEYRYFLKAADLLDSIHFLTNFGTGRRAKAVLQQLNHAYDTMLINTRYAFPELSELTADKMGLVLHEIREQVMSEDWTE
jgi:5'-deoxynucleotidase YfbR-like HD superfamily hydrolase